MNILTPTPADRLELKGLNSLKLIYPFPASRNAKVYIYALGLRVIGYLNSNENLL